MDKKKKYMFVTRTLAEGGAERFVATFSGYLASVGEDVYVVCWNKKENEYNIDEKVNLIYLPQRKENIKRKIQRISDIRDIIKKVDPDYIIPFMDAVMFCSMIASFGKKGKTIYTQRNCPWRPSRNTYVYLLKRFVIRNSDAIMIQTKEQENYFVKQKNKIWLVPNPVNEAFFKVKKEKYSSKIQNIIMVGRLVEEKNYELALRCFHQLVNRYSGLKLEIYGDGPKKKELSDLIDELKISEKCHLMGQCDEIETKLPEADVFLLTSCSEGMPNALMEAMAIGIPCVSSDCKTGPCDLIESGVTGVLFKNGDINSLYNAIEQLISDPEQARNMGINARECMMKNYTLANTYDSFIKMCDELTAK